MNWFHYIISTTAPGYFSSVLLKIIYGYHSKVFYEISDPHNFTINKQWFCIIQKMIFSFYDMPICNDRELIKYYKYNTKINQNHDRNTYKVQFSAKKNL